MFTANSYRLNPAPIRAWLTEGPCESRGYMLPWLPGIYQARFTAGALTADTVWAIENVETEQVYAATGTGSATEATMLDNALAALVAVPDINSRFSITEDGVDDVVFTARHANKAYEIGVTGGPSATAPVVTTLQPPGGNKLNFGFVALDSSGKLEALASDTVVGDIAGFIRYADAAMYRESWTDTEIAVERGKKHAVQYEGHVWAPYAGSAPSTAPGTRVYLRRALTSDLGSVGEILAAPAGSAQVSTYTPVADMLAYGFAYGYGGVDYIVQFHPTDGTTTVALACDGLVADGIINQPTGVAITDSTTAVTITTAAGTALDYLRPFGATLDAATAAGAVSVGTADIDAIDISSIAQVIEVNSTGFVKLFVKVGPRA
jgi:hypothetical protein